MRRSVAAAIVLAIAACQKTEPPPAPPKSVVTNTSAVPKPLEAKQPAAPKREPIARDLDEIRQAGVLKALFTFNSTGYFIYRGETMGYEYELLSMFARDSHIRLAPAVIRDSKGMFERLNAGDGDVIAAQLAATTNTTEVAMTEELYATSPVVVQRNDTKPAGSTPAVSTALAREERDTTPQTISVRARLVSAPAELAGKKVHVPRTSPYRANLLELNNELSQDIDIVEVDETSDRLIQKLAEGVIGYTVAAENVAALKAGEYTNLVIKPAIGPPQPIVWAVRTNSPALRAALNQWIEAKRKSGLLAVLYRKYFLDRRGYQKRSTSQYLTSETGTLSPFDSFFRDYARTVGWDWRLVAAQAYQESKFNPSARSWAGAIGLMQVMPITARQMHINPGDPRQSVEGACKYLADLDQQWKSSVPNDSDRIKFILGSYNVGIGHIQDAVRLARKHGNDPASWEDVGYWLIRKSTRAVFTDPVVKHGYARGTEPVAYVDQILSRWANYKEFVTGAGQ